MKAFLHIGRFEGRCSFSTWLTRIAINSALMLLRKRRARVTVSIHDDLEEVPTHYKEIVELSLNPEGSYIDCESQIAIYRNICRLPPQLRSVVELRCSDELSLSEIADEADLGGGCKVSPDESPTSLEKQNQVNGSDSEQGADRLLQADPGQSRSPTLKQQRLQALKECVASVTAMPKLHCRFPTDHAGVGARLCEFVRLLAHWPRSKVLGRDWRGVSRLPFERRLRWRLDRKH
jgi:hypothetical protein